MIQAWVYLTMNWNLELSIKQQHKSSTYFQIGIVLGREPVTAKARPVMLLHSKNAVTITQWTRNTDEHVNLIIDDGKQIEKKDVTDSYRADREGWH